MASEKGFTIGISSRYNGFWRYNAALMCGCFDAQEHRVGFAAIESHVADVGANLTIKPADIADDRHITLETIPCDHLTLYLYLIPHTLPAAKDIEQTKPFEVELTVSYDGKRLRSEKLAINQWSGASIELRIARE